jgi:hypothetical protein
LAVTSITLNPPGIVSTVPGGGNRRSAIIQASRMRVLQLLGVLLFVPSALAFYHLVDRGTDSALVYLTGASMYVGLAFALYASVMLWGSDD